MKDPEPLDLQTAALRLAGLLGEDGVLVGGLAVAAHGYVRATDDVDFVARVPLAEVRRRLRADGIDASLHKGGGEDGFDCVRGAVGGVRFDVLPPLVALDWDGTIEVSFAGRRSLRIVDLDGLLRLKLRAQGPRDLMDVAALVLMHPERTESARQAARAYGALDRLDVWLQDARLEADVEAATMPARPQGRRRPRRRR